MRNLRTYVQATAVMMLVSFSALAHQIALKDGRIIAFDHYRASEQSLFYTDSSGKEIKVPRKLFSLPEFGHKRHIPSITTSALSRDTSPRTCLEVFFLSPEIFFLRPRFVPESFDGIVSVPPAIYSIPTRVRTMITLFKLPNILGRQDAHSISPLRWPAFD